MRGQGLEIALAIFDYRCLHPGLDGLHRRAHLFGSVAACAKSVGI